MDQPHVRAPSVHAPWILAGIVLVGLTLRLHGLQDWWLNPDEGIDFSIATWPRWSQAVAEIESNAHPPVFYLVVKAMTLASLDFSWLRSASVFFGLLTLIGIYLFTRELAGVTAGLLSAGLVAISHASVIQSQVVRPYAMQAALLAFALWFLARWVSVQRTRDLVGWTVSITLALLVHYGSLVIFLAANAAISVLLLTARIPRRKTLRWALAQGPATVALAGLWFTHVAPDLVGSRHQTLAREGWLSWCFHDGVEDVLLGLAGALHYNSFEMPIAATAAMLALGIVAVIVRRQALLGLLLLSTAAVAIALSLAAVYPLCGSRHSSYLLLLTIPCMTIGLTFLQRGSRWRQLSIGSAILALFMLSSAFDPALTEFAPAVSPALDHCIAKRSVDRARPHLDRLHAHGGVLILDTWTYYTLTPFFLSDRPPTPVFWATELSHFKWGKADVVVSPSLSLRADGESLWAADHVMGFLRHANRELPLLDLANRGDATLFFAGWGVEHFKTLLKVDAGLAGSRCISRFTLHGGIGSAELSPALCLARLKQAPIRPRGV